MFPTPIFSKFNNPVLYFKQYLYVASVILCVVDVVLLQITTTDAYTAVVHKKRSTAQRSAEYAFGGDGPGGYTVQHL